MAFKKIYTEAGLTLDTLEDLSGVAAGYLSQFATGKYKPTPIQLQKIASALGVRVSEIVNEEEAHHV